MNVKAERIERILQIINRSLLLVVSGQTEGDASFEFRKLQKVDASVFGSDKFAFEMVHFLKSSSKNKASKGKVGQTEDTIASHWQNMFLQGLETLLVECAVVVDDIERDCFVSRVYCWFSEKLQERRDFPKAASAKENIVDLKTAVQGMGVSSTKHTLAGLDLINQQLDALPSSPSRMVDGLPLRDPNDYDIPPIALPTYRSFSSRHNKLPVYVKHHLPNVFREGSEYISMLPKVPDGDTYGLLHNQPSSETEKSMHELWLARRRQEAFDWKTQQHMGLIMDRLDLHKSRLESDTLRRQESNTYLHRAASHSRPHSAGDLGGRFAPFLKPNSPKRPHGEFPSSSTLLDRPLSPDPDDVSVASSPLDRVLSDQPKQADAENEQEENASSAPQEPSAADVDAGPIPLVARTLGKEEDTAVARPGRQAIKAAPKFLPMRYKLEPLESFNKNYERQQYYMQLSDSDDDEDRDRGVRAPAAGQPVRALKGAKGAKGPAVTIKFKRDKPVIRDRPMSSRQFRDVAQNDTELRVHYRYSNYRRMPLDDLQQNWLAAKETEREKKSNDMALKLVEDAAAKDDKKKDDKKDDKGGKKDGKKAPPPPDLPKPWEEGGKTLNKYKSASQFMSVHFPNFDSADDNFDSHGPMRALQLIECARVMGAMEAFGESGSVSGARLRNALVVPQDRPEAISLENLRDNDSEGLWVNPKPKEFWRTMPMPKAAKKGGGKKGKKK